MLGGPRGLRGPAGRHARSAAGGQPVARLPRVSNCLRPTSRHVVRKSLDVLYATASAAQQLDIYLPDEGEGPFPVSCTSMAVPSPSGSKRDFHVNQLAARPGSGVWTGERQYRLSGEALFPAGLQDAKAAVRWLRAHGSEYGLDAGSIGRRGGSSGGNYAAMLCVTAGVALFDDPALGNAEQTCDVGSIDLFGPTDFLRMDEHLHENGLGPERSQRGRLRLSLSIWARGSRRSRTRCGWPAR